MKYVCNGRFVDHILIVEQTSCGQTVFIQVLAVNNLFGKLRTVEWISKIELLTNTERLATTKLYFHS